MVTIKLDHRWWCTSELRMSPGGWQRQDFLTKEGEQKKQASAAAGHA
jgi:hypothetical protein